MHNVNQPFLPEAQYHLEENMDLQQIACSYIDDTAITCRVTRLNYCEQVLEVDLGNQFSGIIPFEEASIYPVYKDCCLSQSIKSLVGCTIRAYITSIKPQIVLSRKQHMLQALELMSTQTHFESSTIIGFSSLSAFVDIGAGINGKISKSNFAPVKFHDAKDIGFKLYDTFPTDVLEFDQENKWFDLSRLSCLPHFTNMLQKGDIVTCTVFCSLPDASGYYVCIDKSIGGIVDSPIDLYYGDEIVAAIGKEPAQNKKGVQLKFLRLL